MNRLITYLESGENTNRIVFTVMIINGLATGASILAIILNH